MLQRFKTDVNNLEFNEQNLANMLYGYYSEKLYIQNNTDLKVYDINIFDEIVEEVDPNTKLLHKHKNLLFFREFEEDRYMLYVVDSNTNKALVEYDCGTENIIMVTADDNCYGCYTDGYYGL